MPGPREVLLWPRLRLVFPLLFFIFALLITKNIRHYNLGHTYVVARIVIRQFIVVLYLLCLNEA